jgi:hypothetical protein
LNQLEAQSDKSAEGLALMSYDNESGSMGFILLPWEYTPSPWTPDVVRSLTLKHEKGTKI